MSRQRPSGYGACDRRLPAQPWVLWSLLGIVWEGIHLTLDLIVGSHAWKLGIPVMVLWLVILGRALRGGSMAVAGAIVVGALGCYFPPLIHYAQGLTWIAVIPWLTNPEDAGPSWVVPYNALNDAGVAIGAALLWTGTQAVRRELRLTGALFAGIVGATLLVGGLLYRVVRHGPGGVAGLALIGMIAASALLIVLVADVTVACRSRSSP